MGVISRTHNFAFIPIPKTGGTSARHIVSDLGQAFSELDGLTD